MSTKNLDPQSGASPYLWPEVRISDPCSSAGLTVFPVLNGNQGGGDYILLADAVEKGIAKVTEVNEGGDLRVVP